MITNFYQAKNNQKTPGRPCKKPSTTSIGRFGERIALQYLLKKGYVLVRQNYHIQGGELDLIVEKNGILCIVEVKLRTGKNFGNGVESLTFNKKQKLLRAIFTFLQDPKGDGSHATDDGISRSSRSIPWQLDLIDIEYHKPSRTARVQHFPNILEA